MKYSKDLTDKQWNLIESVFRSNKGKFFVEQNKPDLVNAVLYLIKTGYQWRLLPNDFPLYTTVWSFYRRAVISGKWEQTMDILVQKTRENAGRNPTPTCGIIDSQNAKTVSASLLRRRNGGKKVKTKYFT